MCVDVLMKRCRTIRFLPIDINFEEMNNAGKAAEWLCFAGIIRLYGILVE
ncbi:hypothetical protein IMSAGC014_01083 [Bacteroidaceae bacterium]|nr:hypothetical protein IMSAGC014_01083 [Bacteroidaceae bacterium]